jgi:hypothetical protein
MNKTTDKKNHIVGEPGLLEMTITPEIEQMFKGAPMFLEIEMLQAEKRRLPDGRTWYKLEIHDQVKADLMQEFCLKMISQSHKANLS